MKENKVYLSYPEITQQDIVSINNVLKGLAEKNQESNLISQFETQIADFHQISNVVAVSSGTSALHLALIALGIGAGDKVIVPTLTFAATAFPLNYVDALPVFIDVDKKSWTIDIDLLEIYLKKCSKSELPKLIIAVDLFGHTCDYDRLFELTDKFEIPVLIDAAEALGSKYKGRYTASLGIISILSFNFNKVITTTGGGALLTNNKLFAEKTRKLANQARDNFHWYEHSEIGFNYRMSPILAALGISQLARITEIIEKRKEIGFKYTELLNGIHGITVSNDSQEEISNSWLTIVSFDSKLYPNARDIVRKALEKENIESRFVWKPLHMQPVYSNASTILSGAAEKIFNEGLCLPSGTNLSNSEIERVCNIIKTALQ
jgi:dTDP-4-amino-4,6-dideoxygalactose transaminase